MKDIEVEIKIQLKKPKKLLNWLKKKAKFVKASDQTDYYFDPPHKSFIFKDKEGYQDADEWFRVRISEKGDEVCYKHWHRDKKTDKSTYADELETDVEDGEQILKILKRLGFQQTSVIEKHRETYRYKDFEFDCDEVKDLGFFVEIEFKGEARDPMEAKQRIFDLLEEIGVKDWKKTKRGYCWIQWNPEREHFEER